MPEELYGPVLKHNGVLEKFEAFASVGEVERGKGFPDVYLLAAQRLGVSPSRCLVFEDVLPGIRGAKAAGMTVYGVYDKCSAANAEEIARQANGYIRDFSELIAK